MSTDYERDTAIPFVIPDLIRYLVNSHASPRIGVRGVIDIDRKNHAPPRDLYAITGGAINSSCLPATG